jgi:2,3-bisphosphoglycerate-independent phosphoglycerate mutase
VTRKALLVILDGFGLRDEEEGNAIKQAMREARAPTLATFAAHLSRTHLETSGLAVGLPEGQMGNSEVGHMNIGAGRIMYQMLTRIDKSIRDGEFAKNRVLVEAIEKAKTSGGNLHLLGLLSDGGVHSSAAHLHALLKRMRSSSSRATAASRGSASWCTCSRTAATRAPRAGRGSSRTSRA